MDIGLTGLAPHGTPAKTWLSVRMTKRQCEYKLGMLKAVTRAIIALPVMEFQDQGYKIRKIFA